MFFGKKRTSSSTPKYPTPHPTVQMFAAQRGVFAGGSTESNIRAAREELLRANRYIDEEDKVWKSYEDKLAYERLMNPVPLSPVPSHYSSPAPSYYGYSYNTTPRYYGN
jgi:hypothetical protein